MAADKADLLPQRKDTVRRAAPRSWVSRAGLFLLRSREASTAIAGIVMVIYFQSTAPAFLSPSNIGNLAEYTAMTAIIAAGLVMVLIAGEVDLSVGQVYALSPFVMYFAQQGGCSLSSRGAIGLVAAASVGVVNGIFTVLLRIPSFITTLGTLFLINGLTLTISGGFPVRPKAGPVLQEIFGGNPVSQILWAIGVTLVLQFVFVKTRWGLHTIATGGNIIGADEKSASRSSASRLEICPSAVFSEVSRVSWKAISFPLDEPQHCLRDFPPHTFPRPRSHVVPRVRRPSHAQRPCHPL